MGFDTVEIAVGESGRPVAEIVRAVEKTGMAVSSLHNLVVENLPPDQNPWGDDLSSLDAAVRREAVRLTGETIELARAVGAPAVVLHAGGVPVPDGAAFQAKLISEYAPGDPEATRIMQQLWQERQARAEPFVEATVRSLRELCEATDDIALGVETRYHFFDIPSLEEAERIFEAVPAPNLGYWHDTGHGRIREGLGLESARDWLGRFQSRLLGFHLHDVQGFHDHRAPGGGGIDFEPLLRFAREDSLLVMELGADVSEEEAVAGKAHLDRLLTK